MASLLFGLPLLTAYTFVDSVFYVYVLIPYLGAVVLISLLLLLLSRGKSNFHSFRPVELSGALRFISRFNSISISVVSSLVILLVICYAGMRLGIGSAYPYPPPTTASLLGAAYVILLIIVLVLALPRILCRAFPIIVTILKERKYALMAIILSIVFVAVYLLLVKQVVIIGYNEPSNVPPPVGKYPFIYVFTVGPQQILASSIYIPNILIQLNPFVTIYVIPFEMIFAVVLSLLTSTAVVLGYYLVENSGLKSCARGSVMSTGGSILGLTATCPTCLVPSFVSVIFGGITTAEVAYSNVYGAVLPPIVSVATLILSLIYLSKKVKGATNISSIAATSLR